MQELIDLENTSFAINQVHVNVFKWKMNVTVSIPCYYKEKIKIIYSYLKNARISLHYKYNVHITCKYIELDENYLEIIDYSEIKCSLTYSSTIYQW